MLHRHESFDEKEEDKGRRSLNKKNEFNVIQKHRIQKFRIHILKMIKYRQKIRIHTLKKI